MKYGFGIAGTGLIAETHARVINKMGNAKLVCVYSRSDENAQRFCTEFGGFPYSSLDAFLDQPGLKFLNICTPSGEHLDIALKAAKKGINLIIEKPMEITPDRCDRIISAAQDGGVQLSGIFQNRYNDEFRQLKSALDQGRFGNICLASGYQKWYRSDEYYTSSLWKGRWKTDGGGALMNQGIHLADLMLWLLGPAAEVKAFAGTRVHPSIEVEDTLSAVIKYKAGFMGSLEVTTGAWPGASRKIEICGDGGHAVLEDDRFTVWEFKDTLTGDETMVSSEPPAGGGSSSPIVTDDTLHREQFEDCICALEEGRAPEIDGIAAKAAVELVYAIYKNAGLI